MKLQIPNGFVKVRTGSEPGRGSFLLQPSGKWVSLRKRDDYTTKAQKDEFIIKPFRL